VLLARVRHRYRRIGAVRIRAVCCFVNRRCFRRSLEVRYNCLLFLLALILSGLVCLRRELWELRLRSTFSLGQSRLFKREILALVARGR
jgi:hypothetical protein